MIEANVGLTFTEDLLGSAPLNRDVYKDFIESRKVKRIDPQNASEETETLPEVPEDRGWTGFHKDENGLFLYDYVIKGFFKEAGNILKDDLGETNLRSKLDNYLFIFPRRIPLLTFDGKPFLKPDGVLERPLRAQTMQGPRVTLARSDFIKAGSRLSFSLKMLPSKIRHPETILERCLEYGQLKALGQWRNGGYGRFDYKLEFTSLSKKKVEA